MRSDPADVGQRPLRMRDQAVTGRVFDAPPPAATPEPEAPDVDLTREEEHAASG